MTAEPTLRSLTGGVLAHNERGRIRDAIRSLTQQVLPAGFSWEEIIVVVSGSTDGTSAVVAEMARSDPRIRLVAEPVRNGKAAALAELFRRARGGYLVLLNGDAVAADKAVGSLLAAAESRHGAFAVMGRPVPGQSRPGPFGGAVDLLWAVHDADHRRAIGGGQGNHLTDELLLLPVAHLPPIPAGIVNDGSYIGGWLAREGGELVYAPDAVVRITSPQGFREHVRQRRRILYGHRQIRERLSVPPTTLERFARTHPIAAVRLVARETRRAGGVHALTTLLAAEVVASTLAALDRGSGVPDHARWAPIDGVSPDPLPAPVPPPWPSDRA
ncbi:MAG: glycosyltransferase [Thermoplasmata archaeon]|nr:glycosyltransferase [Thermoplasmata archaeon]